MNYFPNTKTLAERVRQATAFISFPVNASLNSYVLQYSAELNEPKTPEDLGIK